MQTRTQTREITVGVGFLTMPFEVEFNADIHEWFEKDFAYGEWATIRHADIEPNIISITYIRNDLREVDYTNHKNVRKQVMHVLEGYDESDFE